MKRNKKVLPIIYVLIFGVLMFVSSEAFPAYDYNLKYSWLASPIAFIIGMVIIGISGYQFRKVSTTVNPLTPDKTSKLVVMGLYRYSRNPMYVGFLLFLISAELLITNYVSLILLPLFIVVINRMQIQPEEKVLEELFGDEYRLYLKKVRRWL